MATLTAEEQELLGVEDDALEDFDEFYDDTLEDAELVTPAMVLKVHDIVEKILTFVDELSGHPLFPYQRDFAYRMVESVVLNDGEQITALFSRQSGKTETVANVVAALMILLPRLAPVFPDLFETYKEGFWVGTFAPVESQAETLFGRIVLTLTSERALELLEDPELDDVADGASRLVRLRNCGSLCRMQTANPKAQIESKSYHLIVIDECQRADSKMVRKSIEPMGAFYDATVVKTGTPDVVKGDFYETIQHNKRQALRRGGIKNHFEHDWRSCAKYNKKYAQHVKRTMNRIGRDSDEFALSYDLKWLLERGMFTTTERLEELGDDSIQSVMREWMYSPVVIGVDPARKLDSTVLTAVMVDWDRPDEFGYYDHAILNWLEIRGDKWEAQYGQMVDFIRHYYCLKVGVDAQGVGDVVADRLRTMLPDSIEVVELSSNTPDQSARWKHLQELMNRGMVRWPAGAKVKRLKTYQRFIQQMTDLEKIYAVGGHLMAAAPKVAEAHDDYPDSLALACWLSKDFEAETVQQYDNFFYQRSR